ncbi:hypothetical protein C8Q74DRAFT_1196813 [Fomes fomentarius]|nr:hypothetical protein C8Q74DRAFT_1196813 [Fomes fomentarius]
MAKLRAFLFDQSSPWLFTVRDIRHRYTLWKSAGVLRDLHSEDMSALICLLGTLSTSELRKPHASSHAHPRAFHMSKAASAPYWQFIERIGQDKRWLRYPLLPSDHYWLMRAALARVSEFMQTDPHEAGRRLAKARRHYNAMRETRPEIHHPYLRALLLFPTSDSLEELVACFVRILELGSHCDTNITETFSLAILQLQTGTLTTSRESVLRVLSLNLSRTEGIQRPSASSDTRAQIDSSLDIHNLVMALDEAAFGIVGADKSSGVPMDESVADWGIIVAKRVFVVSGAEDTTTGLRWNCLLLLALARTRSTSGAGQAVDMAKDPVQQAAVIEWQTICVLAALDSLLHSPGFVAESDSLHGLSQVVRRSWTDWTTVDHSMAPPRSDLVTRIICTSFLKLAGLLKDRALVEACRAFCVQAELWIDRESQPDTAAGLQALATEQLYASLVCGNFFERALVDLMVNTNRLGILRGAVDVSIERYSRVDPEQAQELIALASNRGVVPTDKVVAAVGVALAERGVSNYFDRYMNNPNLPQELRAGVASAHLRMYIRYGRRFIDPSEIAAVVEELSLNGAELGESSRLLVWLRSSLLVLIRHQHAPKVVEVVECIAELYPAIFSEVFYTRLLRTLLYHRQFRLAQRIFMHCLPRYPERGHIWTSLVLFRFVRAGAKHLATGLSKDFRVTRHPSFMKIYRAVHTRKRIVDFVKMSSHSSPAGITANDHAWRYTINMLVRSGRFQTAKQFFREVFERATPHVRTSLGNNILHGYLLKRRSSNRQRLRQVVDTYRAFREEYGFVPDHVTVNVLLKAHLRSMTEIDGPRARQLFDQLVRMGYPANTDITPRHTSASSDETSVPAVDLPPFGAPQVPVRSVIVGQLEIPRVEDPLLYKRHVRPLYKMFVKAFYERRDVVAARKVVGILKVLESRGWRSSRSIENRVETRSGRG